MRSVHKNFFFYYSPDPSSLRDSEPKLCLKTLRIPVLEGAVCPPKKSIKKSLVSLREGSIWAKARRGWQRMGKNHSAKSTHTHACQGPKAGMILTLLWWNRQKDHVFWRGMRCSRSTNTVTERLEVAMMTLAFTPE